MLLRLAPRFLIAAALFGAFFSYTPFDNSPAPSDADMGRAAAAVVFTDDFGRVDRGLLLVDAGIVRRLYVSGVNPEAGILPENFVAQFSARNPQITKFRWLVDCCVEWGGRSEITCQNALEVRCWTQRRGVFGLLLLITGRKHMARAHSVVRGSAGSGNRPGHHRGSRPRR